MQTEYILKAIDAALAAGKEILNVYNDPSSDFQIERKADNSPLTCLLYTSPSPRDRG